VVADEIPAVFFLADEARVGALAVAVTSRDDVTVAVCLTVVDSVTVDAARGATVVAYSLERMPLPITMPRRPVAVGMAHFLGGR
jgi:hypothetical protein